MQDCEINLSLSMVQAVPQILILMLGRLLERLSWTVGGPGASFALNR